MSHQKYRYILKQGIIAARRQELSDRDQDVAQKHLAKLLDVDQSRISEKLNGKVGCTEIQVQTLFAFLFTTPNVPSALTINNWTDLCDRKPRSSTARPVDQEPRQNIADADVGHEQASRRLDAIKINDAFRDYRLHNYKYLIAVRIAGESEIFGFPSREERDAFIGDINVDPSIQYAISEAEEPQPDKIGEAEIYFRAPTILAPLAVAHPVPAGEMTNSIGMKFVIIPTGTFLMGSPPNDTDAEDQERPEHQVYLSTPFYLAIHPVTQGQYRAITGQSPSKYKGSDDLPVEGVSWFSALGFCNALSRRENLPPFYKIVSQDEDPNAVYVADWNGPGYRLPTEAEWEYSCRAGSKTRYPFGNDEQRLGEHAWYGQNSGKKTHPVGLKTPNSFGLFDMLGNVLEWCWDSYDPAYYIGSPEHDPRGPTWTLSRVMRGSCWGSNAGLCRAAYRDSNAPDGWTYYLGFRVARNAYK